jgi:hypothetical protein
MDGDDAIKNLAQWVDDALNTRCRLTTPAAQNVPDSANATVSWTVEDIDPKGMFTSSSSTSAIFISRPGRYRVNAQIAFASGAVAGYRRISLARNGVVVGQSQCAPLPVAQATQVGIVATFVFQAGQWLEVWAAQTSGAALGLSVGAVLNWFEVEYAGAV